MSVPFVKESTINAGLDGVFAYHARPGALERLTPPWETLEVLERRGGIADRGVLRARVGPGVVLHAEHTDFEPPRMFRDRQVHGPFRHYVHTHNFDAVDSEHTRLRDHIDYALPLGALGRLLGGALVRAKLERMFAYRHSITAIDNERIAWALPFGTKRIAITGSTGLIGTALGRFLTLSGHDVVPLVRRGSGGIAWDPEAGRIDAAALEGVDAIVHLAGENLVNEAWSPAFKARILDSREKGTALLARTIATMQRKPAVLVSATAIGYYGDGGDAWLDEDSPSGNTFLAEVCRKWEAAADAPVRTVKLRIGIVLSGDGGPLREMLTPFRFGAGGPFGSGKQYMSWIGIDDVIGVIHRAIFDTSLSGPVNCVAPNPVTNKEFARTLGRVLVRPSFAPAPAFVLKAILGAEKARELLLTGQRLKPARLQAAGFRFLHTELEPALRHLLGK